VEVSAAAAEAPPPRLGTAASSAARSYYDLVVIGGGNAGYTPAIRASQLGMRVALIERSKLGGNCLHRGCIPTKAMLRAASMLADLRRHGEDLGVLANGVSFDYARAATHRDRVVEQLHRGTRGLMRKNGITVYEGVGSFVGPEKVEVEGPGGKKETLDARYVLIATGSAPRSLPGLQIDHKRVVTSDDVLKMDHRPASVIILGSGAVGVEFASMYNDFGTEVTIVEVLERIVPLEDPEISKALRKDFEGRGIRVLTSTKADPESLEKTDEGVRMRVKTASGGEDTLEAEMLLVAVGRGTVTENLNLVVTRVETNHRGEIVVDEYYRTAEPGVYAAGDVIGGYWLAHVANREGIIAAEHMAGEEPAPMDPNLVPRVTFCRPESASFGLAEVQAEEQGYEVEVGRFPFRAVGKALIEGEANGFFKVVADAEIDLILGMHAIGPHVTELIHEGTFAKLVEGTPQEIGMAVHAHPTLAEAFGEAAMDVYGRAINF
jgi:dihydrolipoamide dehydrogenase